MVATPRHLDLHNFVLAQPCQEEPIDICEVLKCPKRKGDPFVAHCSESELVF